MYAEFDLDGGGDVGEDEMMALGQARRKLGQRSGEWTREMNSGMLKAMGAGADGNFSMEQFVLYFDANLSKDKAGFETDIENFMECARSLRVKKIAQREEVGCQSM